jgi:hypothetical protein
LANTKAILFLPCLLPVLVIAQQLNNALSSPPHLLPAAYTIKGDSVIIPFKAYYNAGDSALYCFLFISGVCKGNYYAKHIFKLQPLPVQAHPVISKKPALLRAIPDMRGDVSYDFFYRSAMDTPYTGNPIMQHSARANIYTAISKTLPVAIHINTRQSNSWLFKNYIDAGIEFDVQAWQSGLKEKLKAKMTEQIRQNNADSLLYAGLQKKYALQQQLGQWLQDGRQLQQLMDSRQSVASMMGNADISGYNKKILEESVKNHLQDTMQNAVSHVSERTDHTQWMHKGAALSGNIKRLNALKKQGVSSITTTALNDKQEKAIAYLKEYVEKKEKYKQVSNEVQQWEEKYNKAKTSTRQAIDAVRQLVDATDDPAVLQSQVKKYGLDSNVTYRRVKRFMAIKKFAIGRSIVDYSELSAKHISVTGVNAAYNARFYCAVAAGTVDYRYRDFIANRSHAPRQWLTLIRIGIGNKEGNSLILTTYRGSKQAPGFAHNNEPLTNPVLGFTIEGRYYLNKHHYIIAEIAKSSYPKYAPLQNLPAGRQGGNNRSAKPSAFADRSNEAYSIQLFSLIPSSHTRIYGQYKYMGPNFQSFTVFNYNAQYCAWQLRADQYFFKRTLFITASVKNNEYNSPYTIFNYKSNTIFKSIQATLRFKRWPVISAGYMPSSQLSKVGSEIIETRFNMIMATAGYMYRVKQYYMHVSAMYSKFFNDAGQQNFLYYNASTWMFNHSIAGRRFTFNTMLSLSHSPGYDIVTADEGIQYSISKWLAAGGGLKLNRMNGRPAQLGYYGNAQLQLNELGKVNISFDHGFLSGMSQTLLPNDMFRIIYFKTF